jgi:hypothetical protein
MAGTANVFQALAQQFAGMHDGQVLVAGHVIGRLMMRIKGFQCS